MKSRRPYLVRAMHEWISDSNCTPHIVVDAGVPGVEVPRQYVQDGKIVLNVSWTATAQLQIGSDELSFSGRFGGASMQVRVPLGAVLAIYARETGQGMIFTDEPEAPPPGGDAPDSGSPEPAAKPAARRAKLKVVK
jgi:stringent starvation protein B